MKKFLVLFIVILTCFAVGCGAPQEATTEKESSNDSTQVESTAETTQAETTSEDVWKDFNFKKLADDEKANLKVDIYIIAGQSNASGSTDIDYNLPKEERVRTTFKNVLYYSVRRNTNGASINNYKYVNVKEGLGSDTGNIGPELGMAVYLSEQYQSLDHIALILKVAAGGTSILNQIPAKEGVTTTNEERFLLRGSWLPSVLDPEPNGDYNRPTGFLTREMKTSMGDCVKGLVEMGLKAENLTFSALCWMQGEDDRAENHVGLYAEYFTLLAEEFRADATEVSGKDCSKMPIIIGEISETFGSANEKDIQKNQKFIEVQNSLPNLVSDCFVIPTKGFALNEMQGGKSVEIGTDNYHWNYKDMIQIGKMFGESAYVNSQR